MRTMATNMRTKMLVAALCLTAVAAFAAKHNDFSGSWQFNADKSKNVGMMAQMKMTYTVAQTASALDITAHTTFQGRDEDRKTHYDLAGGPSTNESQMGGPAETISKWSGGNLVTTWTSESAVAGGSKVVRTETWSLSSGGKTLTIESARGTNPVLVMVFDRSQ